MISFANCFSSSVNVLWNFGGEFNNVLAVGDRQGGHPIKLYEIC